MGSVVIARWGGLGESLPEFQSNEVFWVVDGGKSTEQPFAISCEKSHVRTSVFPWERLLEVSGALGKNVSSSICL